MAERPPLWRVAANVLNKQSRTAETGKSSSLGVGRGANNFSPQKLIILRNVHTESLGYGLKYFELRIGYRWRVLVNAAINLRGP